MTNMNRNRKTIETSDEMAEYETIIKRYLDQQPPAFWKALDQIWERAFGLPNKKAKKMALKHNILERMKNLR